MLFALWYSYWVIFASRSGALLAPGLALVTRSAYLSRSLFTWTFFVLTGAIFLWLSFLSEVSWDRSALLAFRVLAFLALTKHLLSGFSELRVGWLHLYPAFVQYIASRHLRIIIERFEDIYYTARIRISVGKQSKRKVLVAAVVGIIAEIVVLKNQVFTIINARGELTHPDKYKYITKRNSYYVVGDAILLLLVLMLASFGPEFLPLAPW